MIARCRIELDAEAWTPARPGEGKASQRSECPGVDILCANTSPLLHRFDIPIKTIRTAVVVHVDVFALLVAGCRQEMHIVLLEVREADTEFAGGRDAPLGADAAEGKMAIAVVVKIRFVLILHRLAGKTRETPSTTFVVGPNRIVGLAHIGTIA